ncbi:MAG TPA: DNA-processing protein DprA [Methylomirabilota bacterium]|nr:DNA-processing protein DprA [Methylomirabilota bacterium]
MEPRCIRDETGRARRVALRDDAYPAQLRGVPHAPDALWVRGTLTAEDALAVAVVGSRHATPYGLAVAESLAADLAARGMTVVSGLARGIDSAAHRGALRAGGRTIAVFGSGVDVIYPPENGRLAAAIAERGALVSQFAPGTPPFAYNFPERNRVIAGLALGVVVVEAAERSGSLITAGFAGELGREVMAVPGRTTSEQSAGAHRLIQDGAALVTGWRDVIAQLPVRWQACLREPAQSDDAAEESRMAGGPEVERVLAALGEDPLGIDEVIEKSGIDSARTAALLLELELEGRVRQMDGKRFVQVKRG